MKTKSPTASEVVANVKEWIAIVKLRRQETK
jgi:hypothetical protein